ncbi:MAG: cysteine hydrolase [Caulobacter sp.]|nr:cysteine hydrolase [Caulobacter sp.]
MSELSQGTAVLLMDFQPGIIGALPNNDKLVATAADVLARARAAGLPVIFIRVAFRPGHPEISNRNQMFSAIKKAGRMQLTDPASEVDPRLAPLDSEFVVIKHRVGAFYGTELQPILSALDVDTLVLLGVATGGVVLSTVRAAADQDYRLLVVRDGCADADPQIHETLMDKVFPRQAQVVSAADLPF